MKRILIATTISLTVLATGCTSTGTTGSPTPTSGGETPTTSSSSASGLEALASKPCDLLTEAEAGSLDLKTQGKAEKVGTAEGCSWNVSGKGGLRVGIRTTSGVKDLNLTGQVSQTKVGKYDATKVEAPDGATSMCTYVIAVSESSSVSIIGNIGLVSDDTAAACARASKAADLIAPKLP
ncbi:DUF3558 family protein [Lentzea jiangxiensis]|uniref:DUF3558 domain-containing protein n=1 Tax=Lentzea jiangxiensis TaxID=641025 RepID=A0A1H0FIW6_9PSEU|nr:DUF3558 family protein [Lentzea jiangxiensis]SDN94472.1 Protein of unknown function [Lentzea jiangxiensis]